MPKFKFRKVPWKYKLEEDYIICLPRTQAWAPFWNVRGNDYVGIVSGDLHLREDYAWDGCSGPTIDTKTTMRAGGIHDPLYQLLRDGWLPQEMRVHADRLFREILKDDQASARDDKWCVWSWVLRPCGFIRRWVYYAAVRFGAGYAAKPKKKGVLTPDEEYVNGWNDPEFKKEGVHGRPW